MVITGRNAEHAAAKTALRSLARTLATELAPSGVRRGQPRLCRYTNFVGMSDGAKAKLSESVAERASLGGLEKQADR